MTLTFLPTGELAAVVTYLAMTAAPPPAPVPTSRLSLQHRPSPDLARYRALFRRVGAPWLWFSRLLLDDAALATIIFDPLVQVHSVVGESEDVGLLELDFRVSGVCALAYVGLIPTLTGQGHGRWLLAEALELAWRPGIVRVTVHTCTLDHPAALPAYRRAGFVEVARAVETFPDPRLSGVLALSDAPQVKVLAGSNVSLR